ncbi:hypothetical protein SGLAM104S_01970 [Streptomyces glaucescens]
MLLGLVGTALPQDVEEAGALVGVGGAEEVDQHHRALAFEQVAEGLLAVEGFLPHEVEDVVLDLEGDADQAERLVEPAQYGRVGDPGAHGPDAARAHAGVPAGLGAIVK